MHLFFYEAYKSSNLRCFVKIYFNIPQSRNEKKRERDIPSQVIIIYLNSCQIKMSCMSITFLPFAYFFLSCQTWICQKKTTTNNWNGIQFQPIFFFFQALLKSFLPNLHSTSAVCRRMSASGLALICQHSRAPVSFFNYLVGVLLGE